MRKPRPRGREMVRMRALPLKPMRPDSEAQPRLPLREMPTDPAREPLVNGSNGYLRHYWLGECSVIVTREFGRWHLSIAHPSRYPTWDEISQARYRILPRDIWVGMYLPPPDRYINVHRNCFQLFECPDPEVS